MMQAIDAIAQLRALNTLLSQMSGENEERAVHAEAALQHYLAGGRPKANEGAQRWKLSSSEVARAASNLVRLHLNEGGGEGTSIAFAHWHIEADYPNGPLWMRQALIKKMKPLTGRSSAVFLITGLREAVCPEDRRWTPGRKVEYAQMRHWIESFACHRSSPRTKLQLIVL